jgi:hypothetical protein
VPVTYETFCPCRCLRSPEGATRLGLRTVNDSALLQQAADLGRRGLYVPRVEHVLPLASIAEAHTLAQNGSGNIVVTVTRPS